MVHNHPGSNREYGISHNNGFPLTERFGLQVYSEANKTLVAHNITQEVGFDELGDYYDLAVYYNLMENGKALQQQYVVVFRLYTDKDYVLLGQVSFMSC